MKDYNIDIDDVNGIDCSIDGGTHGGIDGGIHGGIDGAIDGGKSFCSLKPNIEKIISPRDEVEWSWDQASRGFEASYALTHQPRPQGVVILRWKVECQIDDDQDAIQDGV